MPPRGNKIKKFKNVDEKTMLKLGWIYNDKENNFENFELKKTKGIFRIGCFGDSFTYGSEVSRGYDYPALLQKIFEKHGYQDIQVINFGSSGFGFFQSFIMCKYVGCKFDLDCVIFGPNGWGMIMRDLTFNTQAVARRNIYALSARYILQNNTVKLIEVSGSDYFERMLRYFSWIPEYKYLKYDCFAPVFLECFFPNRLLVNPFYYQADLEEELKEIYRLLILDLIRNNKLVVITDYSNYFKDFKQPQDAGNFFILNLKKISGFPYQTFYGHNSPFGNELLARQIFNFFMNKKQNELTIVKMKDIEAKPIKKSLLCNFSDFDSMKVYIKDKEFGQFVAIRQPLEKRDNDKSKIFKNEKIKSLLILKVKEADIINNYFLPVKFSLNGKSKLYLKVKTFFKTKTYCLGNIKMVSEKLKMGFLVDQNIDFDQGNKKIFLEINEDLFNMIKAEKYIVSSKFFIDRHLVCPVKLNCKYKIIELMPVDEPICIRAQGDKLIDLSLFEDNTSIDIVGFKNNKEELRTPLSQLYKKEIIIDFNSYLN
ncbi:MAG: hypothetical protein ABIG64_08535 [Candidatus Omnitrophota bacterium]